jgi:hypothetical protein
VDGAFSVEMSGSARLGFVSGLEPGCHTFEVQGVCGAMVMSSQPKEFIVLTSTPHTRPIESMECAFQWPAGVLTAALVLSTPSIFIDVYIRRVGTQGISYVKTVPGNATTIQVTDALATDRLFLQFFDRNCYGSELIGCPGPSCLPVLDLRVCQDLYGDSPRVFLTWLPNAVIYTGFDIFVDGAKVGHAGGTSGLFYIETIGPGPHVFGVQGICDGEVVEIVTAEFLVLTATPHESPLKNLRCSFEPVEETITATWLPGKQASAFIDVYVRRPGVSRLDWAGTIDGSRTRVRVRGAHEGDQLVLQFFNEDCYGSPLITCTDPGPGDFVRGDANGSRGVDLTDAIFTLNFLFLGGIDPLCLDSVDANDDGAVNIADPVHVLNWLFSTGKPPPPPGGQDCGPDPTEDTLAHCLSAACD